MIDACIEQNAQTIMQLVRSASFQPNSRWIATRTGIPIDAVNAALDRLLRERQLQMQTIHHWKPLS
jgi:hypothetical protein